MSISNPRETWKRLLLAVSGQKLGALHATMRYRCMCLTENRSTASYAAMPQKSQKCECEMFARKGRRMLPILHVAHYSTAP